MYFSPLLISLPYSSMRVTSGDGNSLILLKLFILCFDFADSSTRSIILQPYNWADTAKVCESFYFRFLSKVQKLHSSVKRWLIKAPPPMRLLFKNNKPLKRLLIVAKFTRLHLFLLFLAICRIRFLTLINN